MILQEHPKAGDTIKGYTLRGMQKIINHRRGYVLINLLLENEDGVRRVAPYNPKKKDVQSFSRNFAWASQATYPASWDDCDLNKKRVIR